MEGEGEKRGEREEEKRVREGEARGRVYFIILVSCVFMKQNIPSY